MQMTFNKNLKQYSNELRKEMTDAERIMWKYIRRKQIKNLQFYRQKIIENYIVDFYCPAAKIVIEIDGGQHFEPQAIYRDKLRDERLKSSGLKILRFNNFEILNNMEGVYEKILAEL